MMPTLRRTLSALLTLSAVSLTAQAQYLKTHGASLSVGGTGQFSTILESDPRYTNFTFPIQNGTITTQTFNQQQFTTWSAGFVSSLQLHPVPWAGVAINYGFNHYQERYLYQYATNSSYGQTNVTTDSHELTAGYLLHPKHIPFQPYVEIGGGSIGFYPTQGSTQWRGAGLLETGFDLPIKNEHIGFRISGRSLYYRAPNFGSGPISTHAWRVTEEPAVSAFYRF
jgi:hypothetical protein